MFAVERDPLKAEFVAEAVLIGGFQEAWAEGTVDFDGAANDSFCERVSCCFGLL